MRQKTPFVNGFTNFLFSLTKRGRKPALHHILGFLLRGRKRASTDGVTEAGKAPGGKKFSKFYVDIDLLCIL